MTRKQTSIRISRKIKKTVHESIKRFALKATAAAIVALHTEAAVAISCPTAPFSISGTSLSDIVCDFDIGSIITVENGGVVGGINMAGYTPAPQSYIAIHAGGLINNSTGIGININSSSLAGGISNSGTISTHGSDIAIANHSAIYGDLFNNGTLTSISGTGILIQQASTINGSISNSGIIQTQGDFVGLGLISSRIDGDLVNSGLITVDSGNGILMRSHNVISGGTTNSGTIRSTTHTGISAINTSNIHGGITNSGVISGGSQGISLHNGSSMDNSLSNQGTISGGQNGISIFSEAIINGSISNQGTISGGQNGISILSRTIIDGSISNQGTISGGQYGISMLSTATVNGGITNSGVIQGDTGAIIIDANSHVNGIDIIGQSARIIGTVDAPTATVTITDGAIFTSEGSYNVSRFNINSTALFNMANAITATEVNNSGTLSIYNSSQTIAGDYAQQAGGVLQTNVSSSRDYGQLSITGTADLSQSGDMYVRIAQNSLLHNGEVLPNIISGNTLIAPTNGFNVRDNSYIWAFIPTLNPTNNGINLTAHISSDAYKVCQGAYCQSALAAIIGQVGVGDPVFSPYATLSTANALRDAASQATPELTNENIQVVQLITRSVLDIVPMWNTLRGKSSGDAMLYLPGKIWIKPYGASMTQNKRNTIPGFHANAYGAVIGKDIQLTNDWLLGAGFAPGGNTLRGKSVLSGQSINSQAYQGMVYSAKTFPNHMYVAGQGLIGYEMNDTLRAIPLDTSTAKSSYNSWFTNIRAEMGWRTEALSPNFIFTPELDANYLFINQNGYRESGSPMDLLVASNHNSSLLLGAYGNGAYRLRNSHNQNELTLTGYAGFAGNVMNSQPQVLSSFIASGSRFSTFGVSFNDVVFRGGAGFRLTSPKTPFVIELNYDLQAGNNAYSGVGAATIKYKA